MVGTGHTCLSDDRALEQHHLVAQTARHRQRSLHRLPPAPDHTIHRVGHRRAARLQRFRQMPLAAAFQDVDHPRRDQVANPGAADNRRRLREGGRVDDRGARADDGRVVLHRPDDVGDRQRQHASHGRLRQPAAFDRREMLPHAVELVNRHTRGQQHTGYLDLLAEGHALERYGQQCRGPTRQQHHETSRRRHLGGAPQGLVPRVEAATVGQRMPTGITRDRQRRQWARTRPDGDTPFDRADRRGQEPPQHPFGRLAGSDEGHRSPSDEVSHLGIVERRPHQARRRDGVDRGLDDLERLSAKERKEAGQGNSRSVRVCRFRPGGKFRHTIERAQ